MLFSKKQKVFLFVIISSVIMSFALSAKTYNWTNISQEEYIDNLVDCKGVLQEYKWSKNQKSNAHSLHHEFDDIYPVSIMRQQVIDSLKMQNILYEQFNTTITAEMYQYDLNRMARDSKDAKSLKDIFALFDNNPTTIVQCVSRPYMVRQKTQNNYDYNSSIHARIKTQAQLELQRYLIGKTKNNHSYKEITMVFVLATDNKEEETISNIIEEPTTTLSKEEFEDKKQILLNSSLQEKSYGYVFSEILNQSDERIQVKTLIWLKKSFNLWIEQQHADSYNQELQNGHFVLPKVTSGSDLFDLNASVKGNYWVSYGYVPSPSSLHTAVWTGNEMIVWGGDGFNTGGRYDPITDNWLQTSTGANVPSGRTQHVAVWDAANKQMIIWGGYDGTKSNTGGRYDPNTDTWQSTSTGSNVPSGRYDHKAVWDDFNNQMIIWGGYDGTRTIIGGRYDPSTDSWQPTSIGANVPSGRTKHTAIWDNVNNQMIIWGGRDANELNTGARYDSTNDSWLPTSIGTNVPSGREGHTAIWDTVNNQMIIWGGYDSGNTNTGGRYDPSNDSWQPTSISANVPIARNNHTAIWTGSEMIVWGGDGGFNTGGRYDPSMDSWFSTNTGTNVPQARYWHTAIWTGNEMIVWGGSNGSASLNTGGRYDPNTDSWKITTIGGNVPSARKQHTAVWDTVNNQMIIWGGYDGTSTLLTGGRYDPITNSWLPTNTGTNIPASRKSHTAVWDAVNNQMIIWGGNKASLDYTNTGGRYDPITDSWQATSIGTGVPSGRINHTAIWDANNNKMIIWGGIDSVRINTGGIYDPNSDSWQATSTGSNVPSGRQYHTAVWDTLNNNMIIWGGDEGGGFSNNGGRYDPVSNSWQAMSIGSDVPSGRYIHTAIWDNVNNQMIIWGGNDGARTNTGSRYNPSTDSWQATSIDSNIATARDFHTATWDTVNNQMIVWGGFDDSGIINTGGRYDPNTNSWKLMNMINSPESRYYHTAIWTGSEMMVWGGRNLVEINSLGIYYPFVDLIYNNGFE